MSCVLNIETATTLCSVALAVDGAAVFSRVSGEGHAHSAVAGVYVEEALAEAKARGLAVDAVAVSCGPGSYTGLRIGVSLAKGLCFGLGVPLIGIHTLDILAAEAIRRSDGAADRLYAAMIDARRMEVYAAIYDATGRTVREARAEVVDEATYAPFLADGPVCFFGDGAAKCEPVIRSPRATFLPGIAPSAEAMIPLATRAFEEGHFEDVAYFEPFYLKDFKATVAKNKVLSGVGRHSS